MKKNRPLEIVINPENREEFMGCAYTIQNFIKQRINVPFALVDVLFSHMFTQKQYLHDQLVNEASEIASKAIQILEKFPLYHFKVKSRIISGKKVKYNEQSILSELIYAYLLYDRAHLKLERENAIAFFYEAIWNDYHKYLRFITGFNKNKCSFLSGTLTMAVGFYLTNKKNPSARDISQAVRHAVENRNRIFNKVKKKTQNELIVK